MTEPSLSTEDLLRDQRWLRQLAQSLCKDPHAAEDLVQDTWTQALQRPGPMPGRGFLARVLRNLAVDRFRREARRKARFDEGECPETQAVQDHLVERVEAQRHLAEALLDLPDPGRSILLLRYQDGLSPQQIAHSLRLAPGTVRSRLSRALFQLRGLVARRMDVEENDLRKALMPMWVSPVGLQAAGKAATLTTWSLPMNPTFKLLGKLTGAAGLTALSIFAWQSFAAEPGGPPPRQDSALRSQTSLQNPAPQTETQLPDGTRQSLGGSGAFGSAAGWWLEGLVRGRGDLGGGRVTVRDETGSQETVLEAELSATGQVELDLGAFFTHPHRLIRSLLVKVEHEAHLPAWFRIRIDKELRRRGLVGARVGLPLRCALRPASARIQGVVRGPGGQPLAGVDVALFDLEQSDVAMHPPIDMVQTDAEGRYSLRGEAGTPARLCAWQRRPMTEVSSPLLPASKQVRLATESGVDLQLEPGEEHHFVLDSPLTKVPGLEVMVHATFVPASEEVEEIEDEEETETTHTEVSPASDPVLDDFGPARTGPLSLPPRDPRIGQALPLDYMPSQMGLNLAFGRGSFYLRILRAAVAADGALTLRGVPRRRSLVSFRLDDFALRYRGQPVRIAKQGELSLELRSARPPFTADKRQAMHLPVHAQVFEVLRQNTGPAGSQTFTLRPSKETEREDFSLSGMQAGYVAVLRGQAMRDRWLLSGPGLADQEFELPQAVPPRMDLAPGPEAGSLRIHLDGDAERLVEVCCLELSRRIGEKWEHFAIDRSMVRRRLHDPLVYRSLSPGQYRGRLYPRAHRMLYDQLPPFVRCDFEFEVFPNRETMVRVQLQRGALLEISNPARLLAAHQLPASPRPRLRLRDAQGQEIDIALGTVSLGRSAEMSHGDCRLPVRPKAVFPALAAGRYVLEIGGQQHPIEVEAGQVLDLSPAPDEGR